MNRLFGSKKEIIKPTLGDAISSMDARADSVEVKIKKLDVEILKYKEQMNKLRDGPSKNLIKQKALQLLKQKKMYEGQRDMMMQQSFNMEQTNFATESLKSTLTTMETMKIASKEMKSQFKKVNIDKIEDFQDEMADLMEQSNEIQEVMSRSYAIPDGIGEEDLDAELEALEGELNFEDQVPTYLDEIAPTPNITTPSKTTEKQESEFSWESIKQ